MTHDTREPAAKVTATIGQAFPDGSIIELLGEGQLLLSSNTGQIIAPEIEFAGRQYCALRLDPTFEHALRLPTKTQSYGTLESLVREIQEEIIKVTELKEQTALAISAFCLQSWVCDAIACPAWLNFWGAPGAELGLISLLECIVRHPLRLIDPALGELLRLPSGMNPTFILDHPSDRLLRQLQSASAGAVFLNRGRFSSLHCSGVVVTNTPAEGMLSVPLPPSEFSRQLTRGEQESLGAKLSSRLLHYRLTQWSRAAHSAFKPSTRVPTMRSVVHDLCATVEGAPDLQAELVDVLDSFGEQLCSAKSLSPAAIVIEVLLVLVHTGAPKITVGEITEAVNLLLRARNEHGNLTPKKVGGILRNQLGLSPVRQGHGFELSIDSFNARNIHRLARLHGALSAAEPFTGCEFCECARNMRNLDDVHASDGLQESSRLKVQNVHDVHEVHQVQEDCPQELEGGQEIGSDV